MSEEHDEIRVLREKRYVANKAKRRSVYRKTGRCVSCGRPSILGLARCQTCRNKYNKAQKVKEKRLRIEGICVVCHSRPVLQALPSLPKHYICEECWYKQAARKNVGTRALGAQLKKKMCEQNFTCPYTGERLFPGFNASIDHKNPVSRFPELRCDLDNVEWVLYEINIFKRAMTKAEFISACTRVADFQRKESAATEVISAVNSLQQTVN